MNLFESKHWTTAVLSGGPLDGLKMQAPTDGNGPAHHIKLIVSAERNGPLTTLYYILDGPLGEGAHGYRHTQNNPCNCGRGPAT